MKDKCLLEQIASHIMSKTLICLVGPTAVGKTVISIKLAQWLGVEILSADSRQFYREMDIGTAKPDMKELASVKHHFIDNLSIYDHYDVGLYEKQVIKKLEELFTTHNAAILVGDSGMFVDAVTNGLDEFPEVPEQIRQELNQELQKDGLENLRKELESKDSKYFQQVDIHNPQRIVRALEVIRATGKAFSSFRKGEKATRPFKVIRIGLEMERERLYQRIDTRMDLMIEQGLFDEAKSLLDYRKHNALQTVGYKEIFSFLDGEYDKQEAIRLLKRNSRRYAKRQLTWFKRDERTKWFDTTQIGAIKDYLNTELEFSKPKN